MVDSERLHGLDLLRGISMILGIFLHGAIAYKAGYPYGELIHDPQAEFFFFDWLHLLINSFRMQLFFLLAGFFSCLVISRKGIKPFIQNRLKRIVLPLVLAYLTILPATLLPYVYYQYISQNPWSHCIEFLKDFYAFRKFSGLIHLWFLYDLLLFYGVALGFNYVFDKIKSRVILLSFPVRTNSILVIVLCILITGLISQLYETPVLTIWTGLRPPVSQFLYYGFFFFLGWYIEKNRKVLTEVDVYCKYLLLSGFLLSLINFYVLNMIIHEGIISKYLDSVFRFSFSIQTIFFVVGLLGIFNSKFNNLSQIGTYLARSAYWVYLIHNPIVLFLQLLLLDSLVVGGLRFPLVILVTVIVSYFSYHYFVRSTWIGSLLNGNRG